MYDVVVNGVIAPSLFNITSGTSSDTPPGSLSFGNNGGNPQIDITNCGGGKLPGILSAPLRAAIQSALVSGVYNASGFSSGCGTTNQVGSSASTHRTAATAVGYVTIDVTSKCTTTLPTDPSYYVNEILFDNVLTGDFAILDKTAGSNYAGGSPLIHIRAVPEGGAAGATPPNGQSTKLPYTFYGRFINGQTITGVPIPPHFDRRQPLPSTFAARFIQAGPISFNTDFLMWREGTAGPVTCANAVSNSALNVPELVRFDEHENPNTFDFGVLHPVPPTVITTPATQRTSTAGATFPPFNSPAGDIAGWMYFNLDSGVSDQTINTAAHPAFTKRPSQNWVVISMTGAGSTAGLFGTAFDAMSLGNGCSPRVATSQANGGSAPIGPAPNTNP